MHKNSLFRRSTVAILSASMLTLSISACGTSANDGEVAALDEKLAGKGSDPAMNAALEDRILVDPALTDSSNSNMVKAPDQPLDGSVPPDTGYEGSTASAAGTSEASRAHKSRRSELKPETPRSPDWRVTIRWNRAAVICSVRAR